LRLQELAPTQLFKLVGRTFATSKSGFDQRLLVFGVVPREITTAFGDAAAAAMAGGIDLLLGFHGCAKKHGRDRCTILNAFRIAATNAASNSHVLVQALTPPPGKQVAQS
jgi:hypothetical protein